MDSYLYNMLKIRYAILPIISLLIFVAISSCTEESTVNLPIEGTKEVKLDSIISHPPLNAMSMGATKEYLVIANAKRDSIIDLYALPSGKFICCGVVAGEGPGEILRPDARSLTILNDRQANIQTGKPGVSVNISLPGLNVTSQPYPIPSQWGYTQATIPLNDTEEYLMQEGNLPNNWALVDNDGNVKTVFKTKIPKEIARSVPDDEFAKIMARTSFALYSKEAQRIVLCFKTFPGVQFFDLKGRKIKEMRHDSEWTGNALWIIGAQCTSEHIYLNIHNPADKDFTESTIIEMDWNGGIKSSHKVPKAVGAFCVAADHHTIFFSGSGDSDYIYKFEI